MATKWLVIGPSWVGDMVMAQSLFKAIRAADAGALIDVVAPAWSHPVLARMPEVRRAIALDVKHGELGLKKRYQLGCQLRGERYDRAVITPRSLKSALVPFVAEVPVRTGYRGEMRFGLINDMRLLDKRRLPLAVQRYVHLGQSDKAPQPPEILPPCLTVDPANQQRLLDEHGLDRQRPVVALLPGAEFGPAKQWPEASWVECAVQLHQQGYQLWCLGSPKDRPVAERIAESAQQAVGVPVIHNLCGETRLEDAVDLLALAQVAITNDSGLMHIAAAVGAQVVAIYRTTTPDYTPPLTEKADILRADLGGDARLMGVRELPAEHSLTDVSVAAVLACVAARAVQSGQAACEDASAP